MSEGIVNKKKYTTDTINARIIIYIVLASLSKKKKKVVSKS
jgi:hypothetical protein